MDEAIQGEVLEPEGQEEKSRWRKYGPALFWGTMLALPAMNMGASYFHFRAAKLEYATELLKEAAEK